MNDVNQQDRASAKRSRHREPQMLLGTQVPASVYAAMRALSERNERSMAGELRLCVQAWLRAHPPTDGSPADGEALVPAVDGNGDHGTG